MVHSETEHWPSWSDSTCGRKSKPLIPLKSGPLEHNLFCCWEILCFTRVPGPLGGIIFRGQIKLYFLPFLQKKISSDKCNKCLCADTEPIRLHLFFQLNACLSPNLSTFLLFSICLHVRHRLTMWSELHANEKTWPCAAFVQSQALIQTSQVKQM